MTRAAAALASALGFGLAFAFAACGHGGGHAHSSDALANRADPPADAPFARTVCGDHPTDRPADAVPDDAFDLDGDGDSDQVYRRSTGDFAGNAEFLFYRVDGACATYLGAIEAFEMNEPRCAIAPTGGQVCRLSAMRRMLHDDYQEYFYESVGGEMVEVGTGEYIPGPPGPP